MKLRNLMFIVAAVIIPISGTAADHPVPEKSAIVTALTGGTLKGLLRYSGQYRNSNLRSVQDNPTADTTTQKKDVLQYSAIGGYLGYETAPWFNTSAGATVYGALPFFSANSPDDRRGLAALDETDSGQDGYAALGEAYLKVETGEHRAVIGRQEMPGYRFVSLSDVRVSPLTHEGGSYENRSFSSTTINLAYITRQKDRNSNDFEDMVRSARVSSGCGAMNSLGECMDSSSRNMLRGKYSTGDFNAAGDYSGAEKSMAIAGVIYQQEEMSLEGWNYYVDDFVNTLYLYGQYTFKADNLQLTAAGQYGNQQDVGQQVAGEVDTWFYGIKLQLYSNGITFFSSYNEVSYNEDSYDGGTIFVRWGTPQMFNSFQVQDSELAGTRSLGFGLQYDLGRSRIMPGVLMRLRYADYNMPDDLNQIDARQDRTEATFDARWSLTESSGFGLFDEIEGLTLFFRVAYNNYRTDYNFSAYKTIHGYEFTSVTDDFFDYRLYIDYLF